MTGFQYTELTREVTSNLSSRVIGLLIRCSAALVIGYGVCGIGYSEAADAQALFTAQQAAGASAWQAAGVAGQTAVPADRCDALGEVSGVLSAGAVLSRHSVRIGSQPAARYDLITATPGYLRFLWPESIVSQPGLVVGAKVAKSLGLIPGAYLSIESPDTGTTAVMPVSAVMPASLRDEAADLELFAMSTPQGQASGCFVSAAPGSSGRIGALLPYWFPQDSQVVAIPYVPPAERGADPQQALDNRRGGWLWLAGGVVITVFNLSFVVARRAEFSLYLLLGLRRTQLLWMLSLEVFLTALIPYNAGVLIALLADRDARLGNVISGYDSLRALLIVILTVPLGLLITRSNAAVDAVKGNN